MGAVGVLGLLADCRTGRKDATWVGAAGRISSVRAPRPVVSSTNSGDAPLTLEQRRAMETFNALDWCKPRGLSTVGPIPRVTPCCAYNVPRSLAAQRKDADADLKDRPTRKLSNERKFCHGISVFESPL